MADAKITELSANTDPQPADIIPMVDDPGGTPVTEKVTFQNALEVVNALTALTAPDNADELLIVDDPAGTPTAKKIVLSNVRGMVLLETLSPSGVATISTSASLAGYSQLKVVTMVRSTLSATLDTLDFYVNGDTTYANYRFVYGGTYNVGTYTYGGGDYPRLGVNCTGATSPTNAYAVTEVNFPNYLNTTTFKTCYAHLSMFRDTSSIYHVSGYAGYTWESTSAITGLTFTLIGGGNFVSGSKIYIYGIV